jgi:WD40 repeat protein
MTKTFSTDGVLVVMHFNSGIETYYQAKNMGGSAAECCYCNNRLGWPYLAKPGENKVGSCPHCRKRVDYKTILLTREIATYFDVRGPAAQGSPLGVGGIMHIVLPERHPQFDKLLSEIAHQPTSPKPTSSSIQAHSNAVTALGVLSGGSQFLSGGSDGIIHLWSAQDRRKLRSFSGHNGRILRILPFLNTLFLASSSDGNVYIWDTGTGQICDRMNYEKMSGRRLNMAWRENEAMVMFNGLAILPDKKTAIIAPNDELGPHAWILFSEKVYRLGGTNIPIGANDVAVSNSGSMAVTNSGASLNLWSMKTGKLIAQVGGIPSGYQDGEVILGPMYGPGPTYVSPESNLFLQEFWKRTGGHTGDIRCLAFTPDDKAVLSGGEDHTIRLWRINRDPGLEYFQAFEGHREEIIGMGVIPQSNNVISCSADGCVIVWDINTLAEKKKMQASKGKVQSFAVAPNGKYALTGSSVGIVDYWEL